MTLKIRLNESAEWWSYTESGSIIPSSRILGGVPDTKSNERIRTLYPKLHTIATNHIRGCSSEGIYVRVTQGARSYKEQDDLYALGRTAPGKRVTNAKGGQSWHNFRLAYDVVILDWSITQKKYVANWDTNDPRWVHVGEIGENCGVEWGGRWSPKNRDYPHFQYTSPFKNMAEARSLFERGLL